MSGWDARHHTLGSYKNKKHTPLLILYNYYPVQKVAGLPSVAPALLFLCTCAWSGPLLFWRCRLHVTPGVAERSMKCQRALHPQAIRSPALPEVLPPCCTRGRQAQREPMLLATRSDISENNYWMKPYLSAASIKTNGGVASVLHPGSPSAARNGRGCSIHNPCLCQRGALVAFSFSQGRRQCSAHKY